MSQERPLIVKINVSLVYRDVWTNSQGRGKTSLLVRVWAIREAECGGRERPLPSIDPRIVPGRPWPVNVLASTEIATTGNAAAVTTGGILNVISLYFAMASFMASARTCDLG